MRAKPALDHRYLTHFHGDHMGSPTDGAKTSKSGQYKLIGLTEVAEYIPIRTMFDRGRPNYDCLDPLTDQMIGNHRAFLKWQNEHAGMKIERESKGRRRFSLQLEPVSQCGVPPAVFRRV